MRVFKRSLGAVLATALLASSVAAAEVSPLPAGKPAGTKEAALLALGPIFWVGLVALAVGIGFAASNDDNHVTTPTTTSTGTGA